MIKKFNELYENKNQNKYDYLSIGLELFNYKALESLECFIDETLDKLDKNDKNQFFQKILFNYMELFYDNNNFTVNDLRPQYRITKLLIEKGIDFNQYKKYGEFSILLKIFELLPNDEIYKNKIIDLLIKNDIRMSYEEYEELIEFEDDIRIFIDKHYPDFLKEIMKQHKIKQFKI